VGRRVPLVLGAVVQALGEEPLALGIFLDRVPAWHRVPAEPHQRLAAAGQLFNQVDVAALVVVRVDQRVRRARRAAMGVGELIVAIRGLHARGIAVQFCPRERLRASAPDRRDHERELGNGPHDLTAVHVLRRSEPGHPAARRSPG
jgi:hypothetical protein